MHRTAGRSGRRQVRSLLAPALALPQRLAVLVHFVAVEEHRPLLILGTPPDAEADPALGCLDQGAHPLLHRHVKTHEARADAQLLDRLWVAPRRKLVGHGSLSWRAVPKSAAACRTVVIVPCVVKRLRWQAMAQPWTLAREARAAPELAAFIAMAAPLLARAPRGDGHPVLVLPGLGGGDGSTRPMRWFLARLGYRAHGWGLGTNTGPSNDTVSALDTLLARLVAEHGQLVSLIGWSLGGVYAGALAARAPAAASARSSPSAARCGWAPSAPAGVPATSVYSRSDAIVSWRASRARRTVPSGRTSRSAAATSDSDTTRRCSWSSLTGSPCRSAAGVAVPALRRHGRRRDRADRGSRRRTSSGCG